MLENSGECVFKVTVIFEKIYVELWILLYFPQMRLTHSNLESTTDVLEGYTFVGNINKQYKLIFFSKIRCKYKLNIYWS